MYTLFLPALIFLCTLIPGLSAQIAGQYTGTVTRVSELTSQPHTVVSYPVEIIFTDSTYAFVQTSPDLCVPSGNYNIDLELEFNQVADGCGGTGGNSAFNPQGNYFYRVSWDTLIFSRLSGSVFTRYDLVRVDEGHTISFAPGHITALPNDTAVLFPVYLKNTEDTIAGFQIMLQLSRPDIALFQERFDTIGCLTRGWEVLDISYLGTNQTTIVITGLADYLSPPEFKQGILPQDGSVPFINLFLNLQAIPDTATNRLVQVRTNEYLVNYFNFSNPQGNTIGLAHDTVPDTTWYVCTQYADPPDNTICMNWQIVYGPPADSIAISDKTITYIDTSLVQINYGAVRAAYCGNVDGYDAQVDISDLLYLVDFMFSEIPGFEPVYYFAADVNADGTVDISDLLYLVDYMLLNPPSPAPSCRQ